MSSNFLNKSGLSYFYGKIKEMLQNKQDKLTAGNNIIITDNTVSAKRNVFSGKSSTAGSVAVKVVECPEWELVDGNIIIVKFANTNTTTDSMYLNVNGSGDFPVKPITNPVYFWRSGGEVAFIYDGSISQYFILNVNLATTSYYGFTKLSSSITSESEQMASTPAATKMAYDLANLAYEGLMNKQDTLTPGTGITIENNVISASGGSHQQNLYVYDIEEKILQTTGYKATIKSNSTDVVYAGYGAWSLKIKKQRVLAPEFTQDNPYSVTLACALIVGDKNYDCSIPFYFKSQVNDVINCTIPANTMFAEDVESGTLIQYHRIGKMTTGLKVTKNSVF